MNVVAKEKNLMSESLNSLIDKIEGAGNIRQDLTPGERYEFRAEMKIKLLEAHQQCQMATPSKGQSKTGKGQQ